MSSALLNAILEFPLIKAGMMYGIVKTAVCGIENVHFSNKPNELTSANLELWLVSRLTAHSQNLSTGQNMELNRSALQRSVVWYQMWYILQP